MYIWRQPDGTIYRDPLTCKVVRCDVTPCGEVTACCAEGIRRTLVLAWTHVVDSFDVTVGGPGEISLVHDGVSEWTWTGGGQAGCTELQIATFDFYCDGADSDSFELRILDALAVTTTHTAITATCSPFFADLSARTTISFGCNSYNLRGVTITEP